MLPGCQDCPLVWGRSWSPVAVQWLRWHLPLVLLPAGPCHRPGDAVAVSLRVGGTALCQPWWPQGEGTELLTDLPGEAKPPFPGSALRCPRRAPPLLRIQGLLSLTPSPLEGRGESFGAGT